MQDLLNTQINKEMYASNLYLSMSAYFQGEELHGFANFFRLQSQEELAHANKQIAYLTDVDAKPEFSSVKEPSFDLTCKPDAESPEAEATCKVACKGQSACILCIFKQALKHEQMVTESIKEIMGKALDAKDFATLAFLHWFILEQVEEEALMMEYIAKLRLIAGNGTGIYLMDTELKERKN